MTTSRSSERRGLSPLSIAMLIVLALGALVAPATVATAAESSVAAVYTPSELTMVPGETRTAVLLVQNPTTTPVRLDQVQALPSGGGVEVSLAATDLGVIPAGGSLWFTATVTLNTVPSSKVTALTTVAYTTVPPAESKTAEQTGTVVASLAVTAGTMPSAAPGALTITSSGDESLVDTQFADLYFTLTNTSTSDLNLLRATLTFPSFLQVELPDSGLESAQDAGSLDLPLGDKLAAGDGLAVHLNVRTPRGLQPGDARLVLSIAYQDAVSKSPGFTTGSHKLSLSVFGESAVVGAFGAALAPALFVVPGVLFVLVFWFFWGRIHPRKFSVGLTPPSTDATAAGSASTSPITSAVALAVLGVLFSLPLPSLYRWLSGRDYRAVYGFTDIGWMCLLGIVLGLLAWAAGLFIRWLIRRFRFLAGDPALAVLRKLTRGRRDLTSIPKSRLKAKDAAGAETIVFVLRNDATTALVCPPLIATPQNPADQEFREEFDALISSRDNRKLYRLIRSRGAAGGVAYDPSQGTVSSVPRTDLTGAGHDRVVDKPQNAPQT